MKTLLLLAGLTAPAAALAQQPVDTDGLPTDLDLAATGAVGSFSLKYREGYYLARSASLYRTLRDAQLGRAAHQLRTGAEVYPVGGADPATRSYWIKVARTTYLKDEVATCACDTSTYYLKASAIKNKAGLVKSFFIH